MALPPRDASPPEPQLETRDCPRCQRMDAFMVDLSFGRGYCGACDHEAEVDIKERDTYEGDDEISHGRDAG